MKLFSLLLVLSATVFVAVSGAFVGVYRGPYRSGVVYRGPNGAGGRYRTPYGGGGFRYRNGYGGRYRYRYGKRDAEESDTYY